MTFERAMQDLRAGKSIRRKAWHTEAWLSRFGEKVFVMLPNSSLHGYEKGCAAPFAWKPYPEDFFAKDWQVVTKAR